MDYSDIKTIENAFRNKFHRLPLVTIEKTQGIRGYREHFIIWKDLLIGVKGTTTFYYKIGDSLDTALWFVDLWKHIPSAIITFEVEGDRRTYLSDMERVSLKNEEH